MVDFLPVPSLQNPHYSCPLPLLYICHPLLYPRLFLAVQRGATATRQGLDGGVAQVALSPGFAFATFLVGGRIAGPLVGDETRDDAVCAHSGDLHGSPRMAETPEACCRYHVRLTEERLGGSWVDSEAVQGVDGGHGYCATRKHHHDLQGGTV